MKKTHSKRRVKKGKGFSENVAAVGKELINQVINPHSDLRQQFYPQAPLRIMLPYITINLKKRPGRIGKIARVVDIVDRVADIFGHGKKKKTKTSKKRKTH